MRTGRNCLVPPGQVRPTRSERVRDVCKDRRQIAAYKRDGGDDDNRDQTRDQPVFNGGRARLVANEASNEIKHDQRLPNTTRGLSQNVFRSVDVPNLRHRS